MFDLMIRGGTIVDGGTHVATIVASIPIVENDQLTGATPGQLLRAA